MRTQMAVAHSFRASGQHDELTEWLSQPLVPTEDLLRWWLANQKLNPCLSRMAIDIHTVPGMLLDIVFFVSYWYDYLATAVDVERSFSRGWILINHLRNCLQSASICALMCFGDWCHVQLVSDAEMAAALSANAAGEKKKGKAKEKDGWRFACIFPPVPLVE